MGREKRQFPRVTRKIRVPFHKKKRIILHGPGKSGDIPMWVKGPGTPALILDVSQSGVRVRTAADIWAADPVLLVMPPPIFPALKELDGTVAWVRNSDKGDGSQVEAGIQFTDLSTETAGMLDRWISELASASPEDLQLEEPGTPAPLRRTPAPPRKGGTWSRLFSRRPSGD